MNENPLEAKLRILGRIFEANKPLIVDAAGAEALRFIDDNFRSESFRGTTIEKWPDRQKKQKGASRKLLVQTGTLRRSFKQTNGIDTTTISTDIPYARVHNEGLTVAIPTRGVILNFKHKKGGKLKLAPVRNEMQQRKIKEIRRATIEGHNISMPKRQFMGESPILDKMVRKTIFKIMEAKIKSL